MRRTARGTLQRSSSSARLRCLARRKDARTTADAREVRKPTILGHGLEYNRDPLAFPIDQDSLVANFTSNPHNRSYQPRAYANIVDAVSAARDGVT